MSTRRQANDDKENTLSKKTKRQSQKAGKREHNGNWSYDYSARPLWEIAQELAAQVLAEEWKKIPTDASINLDHYLYKSEGVPSLQIYVIGWQLMSFYA